MKMKWAKSIVSIVIIAAVSILPLTGCGRQQTRDTSKAEESTGAVATVTIGYLPITHGLPVFAEKELLDTQKSPVRIKLQKFNSWTDLTDALNAGKIDGATMLAELAMNAVSQGINLKAVALGHRDGNVVVVSDEIKKTQDLKGKTFAVPSNQSTHYILLQKMLENAGMTIEDVTVTQLSPAEMPSSLASGAIDGYCVAEPFGAAAVTAGIGHVLYDSNELWKDSVCCAFVLTGDFIENQQETADSIINSYFQAADTLNSENELTLAQKYLGQQKDTLKESLKWISYKNLTIEETDYKTLCQLVKKAGINQNPPTYEQFVYEPAK